MTVFATEITLNGDMLITALGKARGHLVNIELTTSIGLSLKRRNEARHLAETDPDGNPWTPLKPYTIKHKTNPRMLVEHGDMLRLYSNPTADQVTVGTADRKAYWHHAGTERGLPARPLIGLPQADQTFIVALVDDHLDAVLRRAHLR